MVRDKEIPHLRPTDLRVLREGQRVFCGFDRNEYIAIRSITLALTAWYPPMATGNGYYVERMHGRKSFGAMWLLMKETIVQSYASGY